MAGRRDRGRGAGFCGWHERYGERWTKLDDGRQDAARRAERGSGRGLCRRCRWQEVDPLPPCGGASFGGLGKGRLHRDRDGGSSARQPLRRAADRAGRGPGAAALACPRAAASGRLCRALVEAWPPRRSRARVGGGPACAAPAHRHPGQGGWRPHAADQGARRRRAGPAPRHGNRAAGDLGARDRAPAGPCDRASAGPGRRITGAAPGEPLAPIHLARLLAAADGALHRTGDAIVVPIINMVDGPEMLLAARETARQALAMTRRFERVVLAAMTAAEPLIEVVERRAAN